ncbi:MAG: hypothetical protein HC932_02980 [Thermales bacterium]|nr:hypothetical protein [Thermales bacterium]
MTAKQSVQWFSYYMVIVGFLFLFIPNFTLGILGLAQDSGPWVRLVGLFALVVGGFYYQWMVKYNVREFFFITVPGRLTFSAGTYALTITGLLGTAGYLFATFEAVCALVTYYLLRKEAKKK